MLKNNDFFVSPATKYEACLLERNGQSLTENRIAIVFDVIDKIVPHLGVFSRVTKMCRKELYEAVYSDQLTSTSIARPACPVTKGQATSNAVASATSAIQAPAACIQRIPYYIMAKRAQNQRQSRDQDLANQLEIVQKKLFEKQKDLELASELIMDLRQKCQESSQTITNIEDQLYEKNIEIDKMKANTKKLNETSDENEFRLSCQLTDAKENLEDAKQEMKFLNLYKSGYDSLHNAFDVPDLYNESLNTPKKCALSTKRNQLIVAIETATILKSQLLYVQNGSVEEYDKFLENTHKELIGSQLSEEGVEPYEDMNAVVIIDKADQELMETQQKFKKSMNDMDTELLLLAQHKNMLLEQLQIIEEKKIENEKNGKVTEGEDLQNDTIVSDNDPFIPSERVFCKYAAMIYTSNNNGKTFYEFKEAAYCSPCGEKTVICPHKILDQEAIFTLPADSTHFKISRPKVRLNHAITDPIFKNQGNNILEQREFQLSSQESYNDALMTPSSLVTKTPASASNASGINMLFTISRLWEDFRNRTGVDRLIPRSFSLHRTLSLIEQFAAFLIWQDDAESIEDEIIPSILDNLYIFMEERYIIEEISFYATHDFLLALAEFVNSNKMVWLMLHVLIGNLDGTALRYLLLICNLIESIEWKSQRDFETFANSIYPFLNEEDMETFLIGFTSFSENKISKTLVCEYMIYCIMRNKEPMFIEMEVALEKQQGRVAEVRLSEMEYCEASDAVLRSLFAQPTNSSVIRSDAAVDVEPLSLPINDKLRRSLFRESESYISVPQPQHKPGVPITRLAQITAYLSLTQNIGNMMNLVTKNIDTTRSTTLSNISSSSMPQTPDISNLIACSYKLMSMKSVKILAKNIGTRILCREERLNSQEYE